MVCQHKLEKDTNFTTAVITQIISDRYLLLKKPLKAWVFSPTTVLIFFQGGYSDLILPRILQ